MQQQQEELEVIVDHRERESGVPVELEALGCRVEPRELRVGDYIVSDRLIFERKTLGDLASSIIDGRLFRQARHLVNSSLIPAFILEGTAESLRKSKMTREAMQGALISIGLVYGLPVLRSATPRETARLMLFAAQQTGIRRSLPLKSHRRRYKTRKRLQLSLLGGLPGIGPVRGFALLERFESVEKVVTASIEDLQEVEGIGPITAEQIRWVLK